MGNTCVGERKKPVHYQWVKQVTLYKVLTCNCSRESRLQPETIFRDRILYEKSQLIQGRVSVSSYLLQPLLSDTLPFP